MIDEPIEQPETELATPTEPPPNGNGSHPETISESVRKSREEIPVGDRGITPLKYSQQIDIAKDRSRAYLMLPTHLHNNAAVMAALVGIAARFNLDPIQLASQTYVQNNRLCFQSQAFAAILYASGLLIGRLRFEFHGEGEDMTCTVSGRFKDDPDTVFSATTPPVREIHPGTVQKDGKTFVKGSPLWNRDVEQQCAYFAQRRWIRRYAPDCIMGMYTREEAEEAEEWRDRGQSGVPLTADRLGKLDTGEGWNDGAHVDMDLAAIAPELPEPEPVEIIPPEKPEKQARAPARKPVEKAKPAPRTKVAQPRKGHPAPSGRAVKAAADRAERPRPKPVPPSPRWLAYVGEIEDWIKTVDDAEKAEARWHKEREKRDQLKVPIGERSRLRAMLDRKIASLQPKKKDLLGDEA